MPRTALTVQTASRTGTVQAAEQSSDVANGNSATNTGQTLIFLHNTNAASTARVLTIRFTKTVLGQSITSLTVSVAAAATVILGRFPTEEFGKTMLLDPDHAELKYRVIEP